MAPITLPPTVSGGRRFPNVFTFPRRRVVDPTNNVVLVANLFNFDVDGARPRRDHDLWLGAVAAPLLAGNPAAGARLVGLASRTGSDGHNLGLSLRRARAVDASLSLFLIAGDLVNPPGPPPRVSVGAQGEHFAAQLGVANGTEGPQWRSVLVTIVADRSKPTAVRLLRA